MPELKGLIPVVGSSIADIIVNNDATTATQADFQNYLVNALQTQFGSFDETTDLSSLMTSLTGASNYTANFNSTDGVTLDFAGSALTLPQILIDFSRLSTLLLSGAVYGVTPTAAARVRTRIQAVNSVVASYNGGALVEETLTFDTWFEPLETAGSTDNMFEFDLGFQELGSVAQPCRLISVSWASRISLIQRLASKLRSVRKRSRQMVVCQEGKAHVYRRWRLTTKGSTTSADRLRKATNSA